jgi:hypothetical protein
MTRDATTKDLRRDDLVVESSVTGSSYGIVVQIGDAAFDVAWIDGGSTSRYRHDSRNLRAASEAEIVKALAFKGFDPIEALRKLAQEVRAERQPGSIARRGGFRVCRGGGPL